MEQEAAIDLGGDYPVLVPHFMKEIVEQISICARKSKYVDQQSGVSARFSIANYRTMVASARQRGVRLGEKPAVPRISDLGHLYIVVARQAGTGHDGQPSDVASGRCSRRSRPRRSRPCSRNTSTSTAWTRSREVFGKGVKIEVGDMLPSPHYAERLEARAEGVGEGVRGQPGESEAVRASCVEFVLAGLYASDRISRSKKHGRITYEVR